MRFEDAAKTIIVPCAGRAERMNAPTIKCLIEICGAPVLHHVIAPFRAMCERWIFIAPGENDDLSGFIHNEDIPAEIIVQPVPLGITDAALRAADTTGDCFMLLLGDCIIRGVFAPTAEFETAAGVWHSSTQQDIRKNYGVASDGSIITLTEEKPEDTSGLLCGMGAYFLTSDFISFLGNQNTASGGALHFTSALNLWAQTTQKLSALRFDGYYKNINTQADLAEAASFLQAAPSA